MISNFTLLLFLGIFLALHLIINNYLEKNKSRFIPYINNHIKNIDIYISESLKQYLNLNDLNYNNIFIEFETLNNLKITIKNCSGIINITKNYETRFLINVNELFFNFEASFNYFQFSINVNYDSFSINNNNIDISKVNDVNLKKLIQSESFIKDILGIGVENLKNKLENFIKKKLNKVHLISRIIGFIIEIIVEIQYIIILLYKKISIIF